MKMTFGYEDTHSEKVTKGDQDLEGLKNNDYL